MTSLRVICGLAPPPIKNPGYAYGPAFMKSFVPFKNAGSWHAFFAVNFHQSLNFTKNFKLILCSVLEHFSAAATELLATMSNLLLLQAKVFSDAQKNVHLLSTSRYLIFLKYNCNFACNLAENCRLQFCAFLTSHSQKKNVFVYVFATNFELLQLKKIFF